MKYFHGIVHGIVLLLTTMVAPVLSADQTHNNINVEKQKARPGGWTR